MFASIPFASIPFSTSAPLAHPTLLASSAGEYGWAAWTYSKTAKLNAWAWHGLGGTGTANVTAWAQLGGAMYLRRDGSEEIYRISPGTFLAEVAVNTESSSVYAETQWLDFKLPGKLKGITGMDFDGEGIESVDFFMAVDGSRVGVPVLSLQLSQDGWTYSGGTLPVELASTEFKLRFVGHPNTDVRVSRFTIYFDDLGQN